MIVLTATLFWLLTDASFRVTEKSVTFEGLVHADEAAVRSYLTGIDRGPNVFRVRAADIVSDVATLPDVDAASASVALPAAVSVRLEERVPLFVWSDGDVAWLVDEEGMLFGPTVSESVPASAEAADTDPGGTTDAEGTAADQDATGSDAAVDVGDLDQLAEDDPRAGLPVVVDARLPATTPTVGSHLPAADVAVMRQLLALTPELLGGGSTELRLRVDEELGYELASDLTWLAVFGHYSPTVQPPDVIPRQVQCLRAVLAKREKTLERVRLSVSEDGCGTYTSRKS